jgi:hypothetical protein
MSSHGAAANATSAGRNERPRARRHAPKADEPGAEEDGQKEMRVTTAGENRLMVYGPKSVLFAALPILSGCTREEATASLRAELQVDEFEIIHARFPCRSPDMHFFGYRFRIGLKGEYAFGDICWDASAQKWMRAIPAASLRSLLLICILSTAWAWRASMQITGRPSRLSSVHSHVAVGPVSRPTRIAPHKRSDRVRVGINYAFSHERSRPAHHTDRCLLQRHVQSHVAFHCCSPSLRGHMEIASCLPGELIPCAFVWHDPGITPC